MTTTIEARRNIDGHSRSSTGVTDARALIAATRSPTPPRGRFQRSSTRGRPFQCDVGIGSSRTAITGETSTKPKSP